MPGAPAYEYADYGRRELIVRDAAERWAGKVTIRFGVELTYESRYEDAIREHLRTHSYDYVIGSVHAMSDGPYAHSRIAGFVAGKTLTQVVAPYFAEVARAIRDRPLRHPGPPGHGQALAGAVVSRQPTSPPFRRSTNPSWWPWSRAAWPWR